MTGPEELRDAMNKTLARIEQAAREEGDVSPAAIHSAIYAAVMEVAFQLARLDEGLRKGEYAIEVRNVEP